MSEEERAAMQLLSKQDISPDQITGDVLKLCNIVRKRLDKRLDGGEYMKKRTGLGGTGGRELSPELRVRFGTYGFKNKQPIDLKSKEYLINFDKISNSNTL